MERIIDSYSGLSFNVISDLETALQNVVVEKKRWLKYNWLEKTLRSIIPLINNGKCRYTVTEWDRLQKVLKRIDSKLPFLGVEPKDVRIMMKQLEDKIDEEQWISRHISLLLEENLSNLCMDICHMIDPAYEDIPMQFYHLPDQFNAIIQHVNQGQRTFWLQEKLQRDHITEFFKLTALCFQYQAEIIRTFGCKWEVEKNVAVDEYHTSIIDNISLKLKCLELEVLLSMYDETTLEALESIRNRFDKEKEEIEGHLNSVLLHLEQYYSLGSDFQAIAGQYQTLTEEIRLTEDDIQRLNSQ